MKLHSFQFGVASLLLIWLAGCGGGGGGGSTPAPPVVIDPNMTVPVQTAIASWVNNGINKSFTLSGWITTSSNRTPVTGSGNLTIGQPTGVIFTSGPLNGTVALKSVQVINGTSTVNGQSSPISGTATVYYSTSNYTILATVNDASASYYSPYTYPATVKAGDTGALGNATTGGFLPTTTTSVYSVASESVNSLLVTITDAVKDLSGDITTQTVYRITTSGNIDLVSTTVNNFSLGSLYKSLTYTFT